MLCSVKVRKVLRLHKVHILRIYWGYGKYVWVAFSALLGKKEGKKRKTKFLRYCSIHTIFKTTTSDSRFFLRQVGCQLSMTRGLTTIRLDVLVMSAYTTYTSGHFCSLSDGGSIHFVSSSVERERHANVGYKVHDNTR